MSASRFRPAWVEAEYERIGREREAAGREVERMYRWELVRVCAEMIGWTVLGIIPAAWAFHVNGYMVGEALLYTGMLINTTGVFVTIWRAWYRGHVRGDW